MVVGCLLVVVLLCNNNKVPVLVRDVGRFLVVVGLVRLRVCPSHNSQQS